MTLHSAHLTENVIYRPEECCRICLQASTELLINGFEIGQLHLEVKREFEFELVVEEVYNRNVIVVRNSQLAQLSAVGGCVCHV